MKKLQEMSIDQLKSLAKKYTATQIRNKHFVSIEFLRDLYAEYGIHYFLRFSNLFILKCYRKFNQDDFKTSQYLGMSIPELHNVPTLKTTSSCRFEKAKTICQNLGYKDALDYINKNGSKVFIKEIKPQI